MKGNGLAAALFQHIASRNLDPQLHTHAVVANMTRDGEGCWKSVEPTLLHRHARLIRAELEKPLTWFVTGRRSCLADFLITVPPPGMEANNAADLHDGRAMARYVIEVMGLDAPTYERKKARTHSRMWRIGRMFRMEANELASPFNGVERQAETIMHNIANDLLRWWRMA